MELQEAFRSVAHKLPKSVLHRMSLESNIQLSRKRLENRILKTDESLTLASWLPYVVGVKSDVFVYNFFAANYGLRIPISVSISIVTNTGRILYSDKKLISAGSTILFSLPMLKHEDHCFILILASSARLPRNHGGEDGYLRVHGLYSKIKDGSVSYSVIHSMPYSYKFNRLTRIKAETASKRGYIPTEYLSSVNSLDIFRSLSRSRLEVEEESIKSKHSDITRAFSIDTSNYILMGSSQNCVSGIWHDGETNIAAYSEDRQIRGSYGTSIYIPNLIKNAPVLLIDADNTGINIPCRVLVELRVGTEKGQFVQLDYNGQELLIDIAKLTALDLGYVKAVENSATVFIRFLDIPRQCSQNIMVHAVFRDGEDVLGDGTHSSCGYTNKLPYRSTQRNMCIWAPYIKYDGVSWTYTLSNYYEDGDTDSRPVKIRIITDTGWEYVHCLNHVPKNQVLSISSEELNTISGFFRHMHSSAAIQFECRGSNLQGNFYIINNKNFSIGTDHLTGG